MLYYAVKLVSLCMCCVVVNSETRVFVLKLLSALLWLKVQLMSC